MKRNFLLALLLVVLCYPLKSAQVTYVHKESHLVFTLDLEAKTALVGTGVYDTYGNGFAGSTNLEDNTNYWKNIVIPESIVYNGETYIVNEIGTCAFRRDSKGIQSVKIPGTVVSIGQEAFWGCVGLRELIIPETVRTIGSGAFELCRNLRTIYLGARNIGGRAFCDCANLESLIIAGTCISIGNDAFTMCRNLKKLVLEDGTEPLKLGYSYAFGSIYDPMEEPNHYRGQFADCALDTIYLGRDITYPTVTTHGTNQKMCLPFETWRHSYQDVTVPYYYFGPQLDCVIFGDEVTVIPERLFATTSGGSAYIKNEIILPPKLKIIGPYAFYDQYAYNGVLRQNKEITLPETLDSIGPYAFGGNVKIEMINSNAAMPPKVSIRSFDKCNISNISINVPKGSGSAYRADDVWNSFLIVDEADEFVTINVRTPGTLYSRLLAQGYQPEDVHKLKLKGTLNDDDIAILSAMTRLYSWDLSEFPMEELSSDFFPNRLNLVSVKLPQTLKSLAAGVFAGCFRLVGPFEFPDMCTMIGANAFNGCTRLSNVNLKEGQVIGNSAFANTNIKFITIPKGVSLGASAFANTGMTEAVVEDGVLYIGGDAFGGDLEKLTFNGMVEGSIGTIGSGCLQEIQVPDIETWCKLSFVSAGPLRASTRLLVGGNEISDVIIPSTIDKVRKYAFYNCSSLTSVVIPEGIDTIASEAFYGCTNLGSIVLPATLAVIEDGAFERCSLLANVQLPQKLASIGTRTFKDCSTLKEITLPSSMSDIEESMFSGCTALATVTLPANLSKIGASVFRNCASLEEVDLPISVTSIEGAAFKGCTSLKKIDLPLAITSLGDSVFQDCLTLDTVVVHWENPIAVNETMFTNVSAECYLLVPLGTALTYYNAGWNVLIPNLKEAGILDVNTNLGGAIYYAETSVRNAAERFYFAPYSSFNLKILPDEGYHVKKVKLNGADVTSLLEDNLLYFEEPEENFTVRVVFADDNIVDGDSNGDMKVDEGDAINIVNYALKDRPKSFYDYASDMNGDEIINIIDAIIVIHNIKVK